LRRWGRDGPLENSPENIKYLNMMAEAIGQK